ncbi:MAG: hypothetical protein AVDCRST_MAG73-2970 [uncultured Thermomicrobiales bacterium]|uniref:Uncharacterized protein n=1 Tax=uncultured Thermomicrobiales bacterium TaxID=1645740 RepID=A0A6J4UJ03_9BACT|nr:MAG: hypothetical protein AVDCRST_MAG73-2970 [uncultured Thermomicrobiales bacterium]
MDYPENRVPSHESVDHEHPDAAGLLEDDVPEAVVPGTGIMGDETLVHDADPDDGEAPGIAHVVNPRSAS